MISLSPCTLSDASLLCGQNTDASLLPTVSWPAFAIHEETLIENTLGKITRKLRGKYGFKRYLRDGRYTVLEDKTRKYYRPEEIKVIIIINNSNKLEKCYWIQY